MCHMYIFFVHAQYNSDKVYVNLFCGLFIVMCHMYIFFCTCAVQFRQSLCQPFFCGLFIVMCHMYIFFLYMRSTIPTKFMSTFFLWPFYCYVPYVHIFFVHAQYNSDKVYVKLFFCGLFIVMCHMYIFFCTCAVQFRQSLCQPFLWPFYCYVPYVHKSVLYL